MVGSACAFTSRNGRAVVVMSAAAPRPNERASKMRVRGTERTAKEGSVGEIGPISDGFPRQVLVLMVLVRTHE